MTLLPGADPSHGRDSPASGASKAQRIRRTRDVVGPGLFCHGCSLTVLGNFCFVPTVKLLGGVKHGVPLSRRD